MVSVIGTGRTETVETRRNLIPNPRIQTLASWNTRAGGGAVVSMVNPSGAPGGMPDERWWADNARYGVVTLDTAGSWWSAYAVVDSIVPGQAYTFSAWVHGNAGNIQPRFLWRSAGGSSLSESGGGTTVADSVWTLASHTAIAPEGAASAWVELRRYETTPGTVLRFTGAVCERAATPGRFLDGALPNEAPYAYAWLGAANNSPSVERLTRDVQIVPEVVDGFEANREARTIVHTILGRSDPDITFRPLGMRAGTLSLVFSSGADAAAAENILLAQQVFTIMDADVPEVGMSFVVADGDLVTRLDDGTRKVWIVEAPYQEVAV